MNEDLETAMRLARERAARRGASKEEIRMAGVLAGEKHVVDNLHPDLKVAVGMPVVLDKVTHVDFVNKKKL